MLEGDCLELLGGLRDASVDAVVTDPPYGLDFQGVRWDGRAIRDAATRTSGRRLSPGAALEAWTRSWASECLRVLKPGGHLVAFGAPRTAHRLACGIEDAGLELRDTLLWLFGSGMPKSRRLRGGRGTALKPAYEPIVLARRPLAARTTEQSLAQHGTGALNVASCAVGGRYPANLLLSHSADCTQSRCQPDCALAMVDAAAVRTRAPSGSLRRASRLFYCPKASRRERDAGCEELPRRVLDLFPNARRGGAPPAAAANTHPTVKPLALMCWLIRLTCPPAGLVLDPFCGSGSTGTATLLERRRFLGIELDPDYVRIARARIAHAAQGETEAASSPLAPSAT